MGIDPASLAITVALNAASMALQMTQKIEGPRLTDLSVSVADYGTPYNYFWGKCVLECACVYAEEIQERKKRRKTKGGKYNEYTYYGTWATVISDHEIEAVTRMWFDRHLIYDVTGTGAHSLFQIHKSYEISSSMRIYTGTETQMPDPRMQATIEAEEGVGMCPALRGRAYVFFEDVPLEKLGNRLPQVTIEATSQADPVYPYLYRETLSDSPFQLRGWTYSTDLQKIIYGTLGTVEIWDSATHERIAQSNLPTNVDGLQQIFGVDSTGKIYAVEGSILLGGTNWVHVFSSDGGQLLNSVELPSYVGGFNGCQVIRDADGEEWCIIPPYGNIYDHFFYFAVDPIGPVQEVNPAWAATMGFADEDGNVWVVGTPYTGGGGAGDLIGFYCIKGPRAGDSGNATAPSSHSGTGQVYALDNGAGQFLCAHVNRLFLVDKETFAVSTVVSHSVSAIDLNRFATWQPGSETIWLGQDEIDVTSLATVRTVNIGANWQSTATTAPIFGPVDKSLITFPVGGSPARIYWNFLDRLDTDGVTLESIFIAVSLRANLSTADIDASAGTDLIQGWRASQGRAGDWIEPLIEAYDFDSRPHNYLVQLLRRGSASGGTISSEMMVRERKQDGSADPPYEIALRNDGDIPHRIFLNFADITADQKTNSAVARRESDTMDSARELTIDMTAWATTPAFAQQVAERILRRRWFSEREIMAKLTALEMLLENGDVRTLTLDEHSVIAKLVAMDIGANGVITTQWERDHPHLATLSGSEGAAMLGHAPSVLLIPTLSQGWVLDVALLAESQDSTTPFIYFAASPYDEGGYYPGTDFEQSDSGSTDDFEGGWDSIPPSGGVAWGRAIEALGDAVPQVFDGGNTLRVEMKYGQIENVTFDDLMADRTLNRILVGSPTNGWEMMQVQYAFLDSDGFTTLSGFVRGQMGTEYLTDSHAIGDHVIVVNSLIRRHFMDASEIGDTDYYRPITFGRSGGDIIEVEYTANPLRPLSPVHVDVVQGTSSGDPDDWRITAFRRTRLGGSRVDGEDVPIGETSESYKCIIMSGAEEVRTLTGDDLDFSYTAAMQVEDFGSVQSSLTVRVLQVSPALGIDGHYTEATG